MIAPQIGHLITQLDSVDSTSNYVAKGFSEGVIAAGEVIMAHYQSVGRGQHGRFWQSGASQNVLFSFALPISPFLTGQQFLLSKAISIAIVKYLDAEKLSAVEIKWPNDILVDRRKIAGMLLEFKSAGLARFAVIGIGLNVNENFDKSPFRATSLSSELGRSIDPLQVLRSLLIHLNQTILAISESQSSSLETTYFNRLYGSGEWIEFVDKERSYQGKIQSVDAQGQLIVKSKQGYSASYQPREVRIAY